MRPLLVQLAFQSSSQNASVFAF